MAQSQYDLGTQRQLPKQCAQRAQQAELLIGLIQVFSPVIQLRRGEHDELGTSILQHVHWDTLEADVPMQVSRTTRDVFLETPGADSWPF